MQEAIDYPSFHNRERLFGLLLSVIAKHVSQHLCIEDAARRRDEGTEILLPIESIAKADALGSEMRSRDARTLISGNLHAFPVFVRTPGAVELATGAGRGREQNLLRRRCGGEHRRDRRPKLITDTACLVDDQHRRALVAQGQAAQHGGAIARQADS